MNEKGNKRKEWIKTAAIIFLSVLLVLTFFSNTIMNYSLPEVATQYVESGTITAKIRGSGIVESGDPYSVKLKTSSDSAASGVYEVESVEVRKGDTVQKGDVLCRLAAGDSKALEEAKDALNRQILDYEIQILQGTVSDSVLDNAQSGDPSVSSYQSRILAKEQEIQRLEDELQEAQDTLESWQDQKGSKVSTSKEEKKLQEAQDAYDAVNDPVTEARNEIDGWKQEIADNEALIRDYEDGKLNKEDGTPVVTPEAYQAALTNNDILRNRITEKEAEIAPEEAKLPDLKKKLDKAQRALDNKQSNSDEDIEDQIDNWTKEVAARQKLLDEASEDKQQLITDIVAELDWNDTLTELKENISELQGEDVNGEITAPISGTVIAVNVKSGEETPGDGVLFEMQPEGKGYTMQFSVTNDQAKRLSVGDVAELMNSWRYDDVKVTLSSIKPDPNNPGQNKMLTFDVDGSVTEGQSLSVSVGQKSAEYDLIVPNSAIREDNNGKFILIVETKSTPLSNRYIATRVDVDVLAGDDTRSAVSAALNGYEYVITTSTAPVEAGKQVRLANN